MDRMRALRLVRNEYLATEIPIKDTGIVHGRSAFRYVAKDADPKNPRPDFIHVIDSETGLSYPNCQTYHQAEMKIKIKDKKEIKRIFHRAKNLCLDIYGSLPLNP